MTTVYNTESLLEGKHYRASSFERKNQLKYEGIIQYAELRKDISNEDLNAYAVLVRPTYEKGFNYSDFYATVFVKVG
jgi:hypothetical protein